MMISNVVITFTKRTQSKACRFGYAAILLCVFFAGCSKTEKPPEKYSSVSYSMDGSHLISRVGAPQTVQVLPLASTEAPTTAPVILPNSDTLTFAIAQGTTIVIGSPRSSHILAKSTDNSLITELLADSTSLYAIHLNGTIEKFSLEGKLEWHKSIASLPKLGTIITAGLLIASTDSSIITLTTSDGSLKWAYRSSLMPASICLESKTALVYAAFSANDAATTDSILCFKLDGTVSARMGLATTRITSNLCVTAEGLAFGYLSGADTAAHRKSAHVALWSGMPSAAKLKWDHPLPYIVSCVSSNGQNIITGGFRETEGEVISGIDAFATTDTTTLWKRRFSYPLVSIVTVSPAHAYIPFTFSTQATIPTKTVLMTIDLSDGKTYNELPIDGAMTGFVQGVGMPTEGMLLYADQSLPQVYFLKP